MMYNIKTSDTSIFKNNVDLINGHFLQKNETSSGGAFIARTNYLYCVPQKKLIKLKFMK